MAKKCLACPGTRSFVCFAVRVHVCDSLDRYMCNIISESAIFRVIVIWNVLSSIPIPRFVFNSRIMSCPCLYIVHALKYIVTDLFGWRSVLPPVVVTICYDTSTCALYTCLFVIVFFWISVIDHIQHQCMECFSLTYTATLFWRCSDYISYGCPCDCFTQLNPCTQPRLFPSFQLGLLLWP